MTKTELCVIYDTVLNALRNAGIGEVSEGSGNDMYVVINGINVKIVLEEVK